MNSGAGCANSNGIVYQQKLRAGRMHCTEVSQQSVASGHSRRFDDVHVMSAFPPIATM
jgi:hypothetical protein